jgi:hypothetical protein
MSFRNSRSRAGSTIFRIVTQLCVPGEEAFHTNQRSDACL